MTQECSKEPRPARARQVGRGTSVVLVLGCLVAVGLSAALVRGAGRSAGASVWALGGRTWMVLAVRSDGPGVDPASVAVVDGPTPDGDGGDAAAWSSRTTASALAARVAGQPGRLGVAVDGLGDMEGDSAGLALTLAAADRAAGHHWSHGVAVAATGAVTDSGRVRPVGQVAHKVDAARSAGADVVFVPTEVGQDGASPAELVTFGRQWARSGRHGTAQVVEVGYVTDVLWWLCGARGDTTVCDDAKVADLTVGPER